MEELSFKPAQSYSKEDLIKCSQGDLFGASNGKLPNNEMLMMDRVTEVNSDKGNFENGQIKGELDICLLYTSPSPRDKSSSRMPSSA